MDLVRGVLDGDPLSMSRAISQVENGTPQGREVLDALADRIGSALRIGITGPPGVGKSTLVDEMTTRLLEKGEKVGIIAIDPTSPFSGGALLGDRIRMKKTGEKGDVFMRSMATRGFSGGLSREAHDTADLLDGAGRTVILLETVGVGQAELEVSRGADCVLVVLSPESGDGIQAMKAGILEIADILVINKADRVGADKLEFDLKSAFSMGLRTRKEVPILHTIAFQGKGVPELMEAIETVVAERRKDGRFDERRGANLEIRMKQIVEMMVRKNLWAATGSQEMLSRSVTEVTSRKKTMYQAAEALVEEAFS
jgi:LAO/AO transport system kinase